MRKLVTIRKVNAIQPIEGADAIELARVDGWQCVVKKGEFSPGDFGIYFEIDSFLPVRPEFEFLRKSSYKSLENKEGFRLKSVKLRGQLSQGLLLPAKSLPEIDAASLESHYQNRDDLSELIGVVKYEPPIPGELADMVLGPFPGFIPKTEEERIQNLPELFTDPAIQEMEFEITEKMDGTSFSAFYNREESGICSRNYQLDAETTKGGPHVNFAAASGILRTLKTCCKAKRRNLALQGELCGPGIQKNRYNLPALKLFLFNIYDIDRGAYLSSEERFRIHGELRDEGGESYREMVEHVRLLEIRGLSDFDGIQDLLNYASEADVREGVVFKSMSESKGGEISFKVISNSYLLKE